MCLSVCLLPFVSLIDPHQMECLLHNFWKYPHQKGNSFLKTQKIGIFPIIFFSSIMKSFINGLIWEVNHTRIPRYKDAGRKKTLNLNLKGRETIKLGNKSKGIENNLNLNLKSWFLVKSVMYREAKEFQFEVCLLSLFHRPSGAVQLC